MLEIWEDRNHLIVVAESGDERTDMGRGAKVVEEFKFVEDAQWGRSDIDLLDGNEPRARTAAFAWWREVTVLLVFEVPVVLMLIVQKILCFVDGGKRA